MNEITKETRREAYKIGHKTLENLVYEELEGKELTAREIAIRLYKKRNNSN